MVPSILIPLTGSQRFLLLAENLAGAEENFRWDQMHRIVPRRSAREAVTNMNFFVHL
jgi:hypothetical protein